MVRPAHECEKSETERILRMKRLHNQWTRGVDLKLQIMPMLDARKEQYVDIIMQYTDICHVLAVLSVECFQKLAETNLWYRGCHMLLFSYMDRCRCL